MMRQGSSPPPPRKGPCGMVYAESRAPGKTHKHKTIAELRKNLFLNFSACSVSSSSSLLISRDEKNGTKKVWAIFITYSSTFETKLNFSLFFLRNGLHISTPPPSSFSLTLIDSLDTLVILNDLVNIFFSNFEIYTPYVLSQVFFVS